MSEHKPYLIQRVKFRRVPNTDYTGPDRHFSMDYMGAAEFEFGALPNALNKMIDVLDRYIILEYETQIDDEPLVLHILTIDETEEAARELIDHCMVPENERGKEWHRKRFLKEYPRMYTSLKDNESSIFNCVAWWALDALMPFVVFAEKEHADLWLELLKALSNKRAAAQS